MKTRSSFLTAAILLATLGGTAVPAHAAREFGRGNITAVDWNAMQIEVKTPQGGRLTYKVARNAEVKFTDGAQDFPNPTLQDLVPPMYVHFQFEDQTISSFDVKEVGSAPRRRASGNTGGGATDAPRELRVRLSRIDERRGTFEADVAGRNQSFRTDGSRILRDFREGDLVVIQLERRRGQEVVVDMRRTSESGRGDRDRGRGTSGRNSGRVTTIDERRGEIGIETSGRETMYRVDNDRLLRGVRVGDRITFQVDDRDRRVITRIE